MINIPKKYIFIAAGVAFVLILASLTIRQQGQIAKQQGPFRPTLQAGVPISQVTLGQTTEHDVQTTSGLTDQVKLRQGGTLYTIKRADDLPPDVVITKNGVVVYKQINSPELLSADILANAKLYTQRFGEPDKTFYNSRSYGSAMMHLIYSSKGFTIRANRYTGTIHDLQLYAPMSAESYLSQFGQDIYYQGETPPPQTGD